MRRRLRLHHLLLAVIFLTLTISSTIWTQKNQIPPAWDPADHISASYDYYAPVARLDFAEFGREFWVYPHYYAPFVHLMSATVFLLAGASKLTGIFVNFLALAVLLGSVFWISLRVYTKTGADLIPKPSSLPMGVLAALLTTCYHFPAWLLHDAFLDYPLMAIITLSFALLLRADDFRKRGDALWFGVAAGCGMLTKQTFAFFFILPALYVTVRVLLSRERRAFLNLALSGLIVIAISSIWYAPHLQDVIDIYRENQTGAINENEAPLFSFMSNVFYLHGLLSPQIQLPFAILFVTGLAYSLLRWRRESVVLYLWLLSGLWSFSMVANKDLRYTVPVLPAVALLSVCWVGDMNLTSGRRMARVLKLVPVAAISVWSLISFHNAQFPRDGMGYYIDTPRFRWMVFARNYFGFDHRPSPHDWSIPLIVRDIVEDWRANPAPDGQGSREDSPSQNISPDMKKSPGEASSPTVGVVVNLPHLNPSGLALYARLMTKGRGDPALFKVDWITTEAAKERLLTGDYLVVRTGLDKAEWQAPLERYAERIIGAGSFEMVVEHPLPLEGARAVVYRRNP